MNALHLPVDIELREEVRRLVLRLKATGCTQPKSYALAIVVRVWADWGRSGCDWRPLAQPFRGADHPWELEELTAILEDYCEWSLAVGGLMRLLLESGVIRATPRGDVYGLELPPDFWKLNSHLSPEYISPAARGGFAKHAKREQAALIGVARQQEKLLQDTLNFAESDATQEERTKAINLIMRIDRACGVSAVRATSQYSESLLKISLGIIRRIDAASIERVERYLHAKRNDPGIVKVPDRVLENFHEYLDRAA